MDANEIRDNVKDITPKGTLVCVGVKWWLREDGTTYEHYSVYVKWPWIEGRGDNMSYGCTSPGAAYTTAYENIQIALQQHAAEDESKHEQA